MYSLILLLLLTLACPLCAQAQSPFSLLLQEFLTANLQLKINSLKQSQSIIEKNILRGKKTWNLNANTGYLTDDEKRSFLLGVSKDFEWGGVLRAEHSRLTSNSPLVPNNKQNSLTYSQNLGRNFFGKQFYLSLESADESINYSKINLSEANQKELQLFYQNYLQTRLSKTLLSLQKQALKRSQDRLNQIKVKVRDGLSEKSDLYLAEIEYLRKKEELAEKKLSWENIKREFSQKLGRGIKNEEIKTISLNNKDLSKPKKYTLEENLNLKKSTSYLKKINKEIAILKRNYIPKINLSLTSQANDTTAQATQNALSPADTEHIISLNVQLPLSYRYEKSKISHKKIEQRSLEISHNLMREKLKITEKNLAAEVKTLLENLKISLLRISLAQKNLKENTKLYSIGKTNLDKLLRAEEELIRTEKSYVYSWLQHESAVAKKASLYGKLLKTLREYH